jgi:hypothetical protein
MKLFIEIYSFVMLLLAVAWPLTLAIYFAEIAILARRAWTHRQDEKATRSISTCAIIQILAPVMGGIIARVTWRPAHGDNFSIDPREALIVSTTLLVMSAFFIIGMIVGRNRNSQPGSASLRSQVH